MSSLSNVLSTFTSRREELLRGDASELWAIERHAKRVYLRNVSRDIEVQEAWLTDDDGTRQAFGRVRPGERVEVRSYRHRPDETVSGVVEWRVRSMVFPPRSIKRVEKIVDKRSLADHN
ncbi:hypothetical protein [Corynebacterium doosanense]|uniref:Uncharacterized protein n=1 Tax=Corynebacterium doosanense CAU 212 = DSM 45436 TaxID=558173 RepID=A0A097IJJ2_9CORY|nr:hypothetical protein [Corynebacterium doosanense]AIT62273.1 hypothetical protein CDOO_06725 [Corynebacterium doosanense CAU 212 = DSM 45436]